MIFGSKAFLTKNKDNVWNIETDKRGWNPVYQKSFSTYLNCLAPLFEEAKKRSESEFILTLLRVRGLKAPGWDAWNNTIKVISNLTRLCYKLKDREAKQNLCLWLYGHIVEASEPYEIVANLINITGGARFTLVNFPEKLRGKYKIPLSPSEKIDILLEMAEKTNCPRAIFPFQDVFDRELRNAIFHSDYAVYMGEVRLPKGYGLVYSHENILSLINKALAYFETFKSIIYCHVFSYKLPKVISPHPEFSNDPECKITTIVRKGYGLVGLKDNWSKEDIRKGKIHFVAGNFLK